MPLLGRCSTPILFDDWETAMTLTSQNGTSAGSTIVDFLRGAVDRHGPRDALLFKPGTSAGRTKDSGTNLDRSRRYCSAGG